MAKQRKAGMQPKDKLLPKLTLWFFNKPLITGLLALLLLVSGVLSYTTFLKREGFPSVAIPLNIVTGTYFANDPAKVDELVAKPLSEIALKRDDVQTVQTQSAANFFTVTIQYDEGTDAKTVAEDLRQEVEASKRLPADAALQYNVPYFGATGGDTEQIDVAISLYDKAGNKTTQELASKAEEARKWLSDKQLQDVQSVFLKDPFSNVIDPASGESVTIQRSFDRYGVREDNITSFYNSVLIGVAANKGTDIITLDETVQKAVDELGEEPAFEGYGAEISASYAPSIRENISELQKVLLEGLLAILVVGSIVIAVRASLITVISMVTVLLSTLAFLYLIGYSLNVITLFALILGLALIVDDTIIMVEAIDSARTRLKDRQKIIKEATRKISRAMVAATLTACLSFAPLIFVGGILGSFIRAIPVTLIASLLISLIVALIFIPFLSRFALLGKKQLGRSGVKEVAAGFEAALARFITKPMLWARNSRKRLLSVIVIAIFIGSSFIFAGLAIARNVVFNIFPPTKDTNGLLVVLQFPAGTTIEEASVIAGQAEDLMKDTLGENFEEASYYATGSSQSATMQVQLTPYNKREIKSPELVKNVQQAFHDEFTQGQAIVGQLDVGPPSSSFIVQIDATNREAAFELAHEVAHFLEGTELKRLNNTTAKFINVSVANEGQYNRDDGKSVVTVSAGFDANDTSTLVTLGQDAIKDEFTDEKMAQFGLESEAISFDLGQESENQESFRALALAFPALLVVMFILLAIQFRSLLQPLLIFMAIPFSIFGVMLGLDLTDNAISFFTMMGFFALVGLSIKNTILLTDYANQARRQGFLPIDAAAEALKERFRPLFATSMTAVVSLIPLALSSPFWEGLAVVLIFGLLSSTLLVVTVFPYYYLAAEYLRLKVGFVRFIKWLLPTVVIAVFVGMLVNPQVALLVPLVTLYLVLAHRYFAHRLSRR